MKKILGIIIAAILVFTVVTVNAEDKLINIEESEFDYNKSYIPGVHNTQKLISKDSLLLTSVFVDDLGNIRSVSVDRTTISDAFKVSTNGDLYKRVIGLTDQIPTTYRYITNVNEVDSYRFEPSNDEIILGKDLVVGMNNIEIDKLISYDSYVSLSSVDDDYKKDMKLLTDKIVKDNSVYGVNLKVEDNKVYSSNIEGLNREITSEIAVLKELIDSIENKTIDFTATVETLQGIYKEGYYSFNLPIVSKETEEINSSLINIYVNKYGKIESFTYDEVIINNGVVTTRKTIDPYYQTQFALLEESILKNQNANSYKLYDENGALVDEYSDSDYIYIKQIENFELNAKYIIPNIISVLKELNIFNDFTLVDGLHYNSSDNYIMTLLVENGKILEMTIDETFEWTNSKIIVDGISYLVYKYTSFIGYDENDVVETEEKIIYGDGNVFYNTDGTKVEFKSEVIDERSTVVEVYGNLTKQNTSIIDNDLSTTYKEQTDILIEFLMEGFNNDLSVFSVNILNDGTTDTIEGLEIVVQKYQELFIDTLLSSNSAQNIFNNTTNQKTANFDVNIGTGRYHAISDFPGSENNFYLATVTIGKNSSGLPTVTSVVLDETIYHDFKVTTKNSLLNEYYFINEEERTNFSGFYEVSKEISEIIYSQGLIEEAFNDAVSSLELKDIYEKKFEGVDIDISAYGNFSSIYSKFNITHSELFSYLENYNSVINKIINEALKNTYNTVVNDIDKTLENASEKFIVVDTINRNSLDSIIENVSINLNSVNQEISLDRIIFSTNSNLLKVKYDEKTSSIVFSPSKSITNTEKVEVEVTYKYDKYDEIIKTYEITLVTYDDYFKYLFNHDDLKVGFKNNDEYSTNIYLDSKKDVVIETNIINLVEETTITNINFDLFKLNASSMSSDGEFTLNQVDKAIEKKYNYDFKLHVNMNDEKDTALLTKLDNEDVYKSFDITVFPLKNVLSTYKKAIDINPLYSIYDFDLFKEYYEVHISKIFFKNVSVDIRFEEDKKVFTDIEKYEDNKRFFKAILEINNEEIVSDYKLAQKTNDELIKEEVDKHKDIFVNVYRNLENDLYTKDDYKIKFSDFYNNTDYEYTFYYNDIAIKEFNFSEIEVLSQTYNVYNIKYKMTHLNRDFEYNGEFDIVLFNNELIDFN